MTIDLFSQAGRGGFFQLIPGEASPPGCADRMKQTDGAIKEEPLLTNIPREWKISTSWQGEGTAARAWGISPRFVTLKILSFFQGMDGVFRQISVWDTDTDPTLQS